MFKKILLISLILLSFYSTTFSYSKEEVRISYDKFYEKLEKKIISNTKKVVLLKSLENKLDTYLSKSKNIKNIELLTNLKELNSSKIKYLTWLNIISNTNSWIVEVKKTLSEIVSDKYYSFDELIPFFENYLDTSNPYVFKDWVYYSYTYEKYLIFKDITEITFETLEYNWIDYKTDLLVKDNWKYYFVKDYKKVKIVSEDIIKNITNKDQFFTYLLDDLRYYNEDYDTTIFSIKELTEKLISWKTIDEDKISTVYKWVVDNIEYNSDFKTWSDQVYSWIYTYRNKTGVCDWYTKILLYMLSFAWIDDVEVIRWYAYDNADFPDFWHAWVRIGNYYYDPTFDDPTWIAYTEYLYYKLPKELLYVNRFEGFEIKDNLDKLSLDERKKIVLKNMYALYEKYKDYNLMKTIKNRIYLGLSYDEDLTLEKLKNFMWYYDVDNFLFYDKNWYSKKISSLKYYIADEKTLNILVSDKNTDFSKFTLLKWTDSNWTDYRLAYDLEFR